MTRSKHLIVNDLDGVFTTAQIGRRLQQLGCVEPRKRKSKLAKMSDDENEGSQRSSQEHASDDVADHAKEVELPIGSLLKASWGPSARKNAQIRKPAAEVPEADSSDDDVPIALHHSMRSVFQKKKTHVDDESQPKEQPELHSRAEGTGGDEGRQSMSCDEGMKVASTEECGSIEDTEAVPRPGNSSIDSERDKSGESEDEHVVVSDEKTYVKKRPLMEQKSKSSTWGDSETDASDIEDTQDLATALQEVRIYENQLASKLKKRRLERKQTIEEVDTAEEDGVEGETPLTTGRSARKALLDAMTSDEDE